MIERDFYQLPELAGRWGCTVHDLLHLGIQDRAQICVNIYGVARVGQRIRMNVGGGPEPLTDDERREVAAWLRWKAHTTDMPHGVYELEHDDLRRLEVPGALPHELHEALTFDSGWWTCSFDPPVAINIDHLCMLHEEVQRLDREVFRAGPQASDVQGASAPLGPRAETTYLNIIGALLELVRNPRPGRDSDAAVIRELIDNYSDKPGISKTTLESKFADARRRLHST